jgi:ATP-dependent DNA helicase RecG
MTTEELADLIGELRRARTDTLRVEAKRAERELPRRLWETLSAFANTRGGGLLILGLDQEAGFAAAGVQDPGKVMQDLASVCGEMEPPVRGHRRAHGRGQPAGGGRDPRDGGCPEAVLLPRGRPD